MNTRVVKVKKLDQWQDEFVCSYGSCVGTQILNIFNTACFSNWATCHSAKYYTCVICGCNSSTQKENYCNLSTCDKKKCTTGKKNGLKHFLLHPEEIVINGAHDKWNDAAL